MREMGTKGVQNVSSSSLGLSGDNRGSGGWHHPHVPASFHLVDADGDCKVMPPVHLGGVSFRCGLVSIPINCLLLMNTYKWKVCL